jgi:hypothetical protein
MVQYWEGRRLVHINSMGSCGIKLKVSGIGGVCFELGRFWIDKRRESKLD